MSRHDLATILPDSSRKPLHVARGTPRPELEKGLVLGNDLSVSKVRKLRQQAALAADQAKGRASGLGTGNREGPSRVLTIPTNMPKTSRFWRQADLSPRRAKGTGNSGTPPLPV